jgi:hypothetical protein
MAAANLGPWAGSKPVSTLRIAPQQEGLVHGRTSAHKFPLTIFP